MLTSKLIAAAAMKRGITVMSAETIGMAQRGGSVFSHLRLGHEINSPMIALGDADIIIGFEPAEAVRMLPYLKADGVVVTSSHPVMPVTSVLKNSSYNGREMIEYMKKNVKNLIVVDTDKAIDEIGSAKVLNMVLLGAACSSLGISKSDIKEALKKRVRPELCEMNFRAIDYFETEKLA